MNWLDLPRHERKYHGQTAGKLKVACGDSMHIHGTTVNHILGSGREPS